MNMLKLRYILEVCYIFVSLHTYILITYCLRTYRHHDILIHSFSVKKVKKKGFANVRPLII